MSTRGYYGIKKRGELKGSYNHWDSYPSGLGKDLVKELNKIKKDDRLKVLNETFDYIELIDSNIPPTEEQKEVCQKANVVDLGVSNRSLDDWYCLLRKTQGDLSTYINKIVPYMENGNSFLDDSLFCEWAYIINLDTNKLEIYTSGNCKQDELDLLELDLDRLLSLENYDDEDEEIPLF
ncbi:MAG: hypothetical protein IJH63_01520 [Methanobrevibacter sp.]|nr:hypothetical protein [Romboutsia sp.]MBQ7277372.1 hypothetical protein [Bacilli bacterium]MBR0369386.1 hypothetical protein [Methanobrevibacter sp.]